MKEEEMKTIADWIAQVVNEIKTYKLPEDKEEKRECLKKFKEEMRKNEEILKIKQQVLEFSKKFPIPAIL